MPCSYCETPGHGIDECPERLDEKFADSREFDADGSRVELREGETRDDDSHADVVAAQLAEADDDDLEAIDESEDEVRTDGGMKLDRRYICTACGSIVRARWFGPGSFAVGCDCQTVPVVPQMGQHETPDKWRVERPECCRGVEPKTLEMIYGERGKDYRCPDCGAEYVWDGKMVGAPESDDRTEPDDDQELVTDGGTDAEQRTIWDITPADVKVELSDGKVRMRERAIYNGRLRVHKALQMGSHPDPDCANLYISAESRDGADVELNLEQAKELRDALDECIEQTVETIEESELEIDVSTDSEDHQ